MNYCCGTSRFDYCTDIWKWLEDKLLEMNVRDVTNKTNELWEK
jgi:hypothetical protein